MTEVHTFECPACKQETPEAFGHGDCQTCDDCCACYWDSDTNQTVRCFPYGISTQDLTRYNTIRRYHASEIR